MDLKTYFIELQSTQRATDEREGNISSANAKLQRGALLSFFRTISENMQKLWIRLLQISSLETL
jgi:hypothetical protein